MATTPNGLVAGQYGPLTTHTTASFTPRANSTIYAYHVTDGVASTTTITDSGGRTWTQVTNATNASTNAYTWSALAGASPAAMTITFTNTASAYCGYGVVDVGSDWSLIATQKAANYQATGTPTLSGTLPLAATSGNTALSFFGQNHDVGASAVPTPTGFTRVINTVSVVNAKYEPIEVSYSTTFTSTSTSVAHSESALASSGAILEFALVVTPPTRVGRYSPTGNYSTTTTPKTTVETFNIVVGDRFWCQAQVENDLSQTVQTPSVSTGAITWTLEIRSPAASGSGQTSSMWAWSGICTTAGTAATISLIRPASDTSLWWGFSVTHVRGSSGLGVKFDGNNATGSSAPSVAQTVAANSLVLFNVNDWAAIDGTTRAYRMGATETNYFISGVHHTAYGAYVADTTAGTFTAGLTTPSTMTWRLSGVEFLGVAPAAGEPVLNGRWQLEDASGNWLLEDGSGYWVTEDFVSTGTTLNPTGFDDADSTGSPTVTTVTTTSPTGIASPAAFGTTAVTGSLSSSPTGIATAESVGLPSAVVIPPTQAMSPIGIATAEVVGTQAVSTVVTVSPVAIATAEVIGTQAVSTVLTATTVGVATAEAIGNPSAVVIPPTQAMSPVGIATAEVFGTQVVSTVVIALPIGIATAEVIGTQSVTTVVTATTVGVGTVQAVGVPSANSIIILSPIGIATAEVAGVPSVTTVLTSTAVAVVSSEAFGTPSAASQAYATAVGIASGELFGSTAAFTVLTSLSIGIASEETFGLSAALSKLTSLAIGIASTETLGVPSVTTQSSSIPVGIASAEVFGAQSASGILYTTAVEIASGQTFGVTVLDAKLTATPNGITSGESFGLTVMTARLDVSLNGIATAQAFGITSANGVVTSVTVGIASAAALGVPAVTTVVTVTPDGIFTTVVFGNTDIFTKVVAFPIGVTSDEAFGAAYRKLIADFIGWGIPMGIETV